MNGLRYIKDIILRNKYRYIAGLLCLLTVDILQLALPKILGTVTDLLKSGSMLKESLIRYAAIIAVIALGIAVFRFLWRYLVLGVSRSIEETLRNRFYAHLQNLSIHYYNNHRTGDLMAHATNDISNVTSAAGIGLVLAIDSALIPIVALVMMFNTAGAKLTLVSFSPLLLLAAGIVFFFRMMQTRIQNMQEAFSRLTETARENFSGIRIVKSFVQEMRQVEQFGKANQHNRQMNLKFMRLMSMMFPAIMSISALSSAIALWYGGMQVIDGYISLGDFVAFNSYLMMLIWPIASLGWVASIFQRGRVSLKRVNAIMDEKPEIRDDENTAAVTAIEGKITFRDLSFTYPGSAAPALKGINITVEKGKTLAIVGRTGSGKTTLASLILRLYNVKDGSLLIDGLDINRIPLSVLRGHIGCVPQDTFLFSTTLRENIDFFGSNSEDSIIKAAKTARIYNDIMEFPNRFDTFVGERGVTLSGGQKQRIAIARAILKSPAILILDDCLSAVDTHTEEEVLKELKELMKRRTSIIISHRISTIRDADEIVVLEGGEIAEKGTHEGLLALQGIYYNLYQKQLLAEQMEEAE